MKIHSKHIIRTLDIFYAIFLPLGSILLAGVIFFIIGGVYTILIQHFPIIDSVPFWIVGRIYICLCAIAILCGTIHHFRWFILRKKFNIPCHHCGKMVEATRKEELEITLRVTPWAHVYVYANAFHCQIYRPRLYYQCASCCHEEYICPYCHESVGKEDKKCPHCERRIYTPL